MTTAPGAVDPAQLADAEAFWRGFMRLAKVFVAGVAMVVVLLALVTL